jgi:L-rhamnose mutarotase
MKRYCLALDLKDDQQLISEYERWHQKENAWPGITKSILDANISNMEIYRTGNRLFMIMEVTGDYSHERKKIMDESNPKVQEWERLMENFQQPLPWAKEGEKWVLMQQIFSLGQE